MTGKAALLGVLQFPSEIKEAKAWVRAPPTYALFKSKGAIMVARRGERLSAILEVVSHVVLENYFSGLSRTLSSTIGLHL